MNGRIVKRYGKETKVVLGIDPGLANTGWGVVAQTGPRLECVAYGTITTSSGAELSLRLKKIYDQLSAVISRYRPTAVGIETIWFGVNAQSAMATAHARGAALVACACWGLQVGEYQPSKIKSAVVGTGDADKYQVQYMMKQVLGLSDVPKPDHAADALAAAICYTVYGRTGGTGIDTRDAEDGMGYLRTAGLSAFAAAASASATGTSVSAAAASASATGTSVSAGPAGQPSANASESSLDDKVR